MILVTCGLIVNIGTIEIIEQNLGYAQHRLIQNLYNR